MNSHSRQVSYPAPVGWTDGLQAPSLRGALPHSRARDTGPIPFASWRAARDRTLAAMFAGQNRLVVTGPPGVGKTLLLHDIARVLRYAGWDAAVQLRTLSMLEDAAPAGKPRAILVDEADRLTATELQSLRDTAGSAILLAGLDSLDGRCPGWTRVTLAPLTPGECTAFIGLWLAQAGHPSTLLDDDAAIRAADLSHGVPRLLANLLSGAVWLAVSNGATLVSGANVEEAADFRDCLAVPSIPDDMVAFGSTAALAAPDPTPIDVNGPLDLADPIAQNRIDAGPPALRPPPPASTGPAPSAVGETQENDTYGSGAHDSGAYDSGAHDNAAQHDRARDDAALMPIPTRARSDTLQTRPRVLAFAMVGMVCIVGVVCIAAAGAGTGWLSFRPNAAATTLPTASRSGPDPVRPAGLPAVADAELAAVMPARSNGVQLAGLTPASELRVPGTAWQSPGYEDDADQRVVSAALNPDALSLGQGTGRGAGTDEQYAPNLQTFASTDPTPGPVSPDAASASASPAEAPEQGTIPPAATRDAEETSPTLSSATDGPASLISPSKAEPGQEPLAAPEPTLPGPAPVSSTLPAVEPAPDLVPPDSVPPDSVPAATEPVSPFGTAPATSSSASGEVPRAVVPVSPAEAAPGPSPADTPAVSPGIAASAEPEPEAPPVDAVRAPVTGTAPTMAEGPAPPPVASLSPASLALLVQRGHQLIEVGDVSGARLLYGRAAASGSGIAALSMGRTFDPAFLQHMGARIAPNAAAAVDWYRRAAALGNTDAAALLQQRDGPGAKQIRSGQ